MKYLALALVLTACGTDRNEPYYKAIDNTIEPNKVVDHIAEFPVCLYQCDILLVRGVGKFYCNGSPQWIPLTSPIACPMK